MFPGLAGYGSPVAPIPTGANKRLPYRGLSESADMVDIYIGNRYSGVVYIGLRYISAGPGKYAALLLEGVS